MIEKLSKILLILVLAGSYAYAENAPTKADNKAQYKLFQEMFEKTQREYVEEPDKQKMIDAAITGMVSSLDPYSTYLKDEEVEYFSNWADGEFGGIGVEILPEPSAIKIISPIDDLAAHKAGIQAGDYIVAVNGEAIATIGHYKAVKNLRGEPGTKVKVTILREGENKVREYELVRELVHFNAIKSNRDGDIGYIRIVTFNKQTATELKKAMKTILEKSQTPLKGLILDMRNNPGGLLDQAVSVSEYFVDSGVIVSTKGRTSASVSSYSASKFVAKAPKIPVVVLINGGSASASEIVAGALQDHKRAVIMGTKSFGKGSVQLFMPLDKRSALYLTIAKYYTPKERMIHMKGIVPDIIVEQGKVEYPIKDGDKKTNSALNNYLKETEKKKGKDMPENKNKPASKEIEEEAIAAKQAMSDMYKNDYQYSRAYDLLYGMSIGTAGN